MTTQTRELVDTSAEPHKSHDMWIVAGLLAFIFLPTLLAFAVNMLAH